MLTAEQKQQQSIRTKSIIATVLLVILLFMATLFVIALQGYSPPKDQKEYTTVGEFDFGDMGSGSGVTSFDESNQEGGQVAPKNSDESSSTDEKVDENVISGDNDSKVKANDKSSVSDNKSNKNQNNNKESNSNKNTSDKKGGVIDGNGMFTFGSGSDGLNGRKPLSLPSPKYNVQQETKITYRIWINPNGSVKKVKPVTLTSAIELKNAGIRAIRKWKFEEAPGDKVQVTKVTITFKLK